MKRSARILKAAPILLFTLLHVTAAPPPEQTWTGRISDSMCGASHRKRAESENLTDRECVIECIKDLAGYVLVDENNGVISIATQDFPGLPFYAGRAVKVKGEIKNGEIVLSRMESAP